MDRPSLWSATARPPPFPPLETSLSADVVVVGGGIAGVTAALLLQRSGAEVVLLEARRLGGGETGHTTAHLTEVLDARYHALESSFGLDGARAAAASSRAAIDRIEALVGELDTPCGFARVPGFLVARTADQRRELEKELEAMLRVGLDAGWTDALPYPVESAGAIRIERQAQLHPLEYLRELAARAAAAGARIYEGSRVRDVRDGRPASVVTDRGSVTARDILVLTNHPVSGRFGVHTKIADYRTYAIALGPVAAPDAAAAEGLLWDLDDPYHYVRTHATPEGTFLVVGGEDHKTGHEGASPARFAALEAWARPLWPPAPVAHRWSGQVVEPTDGLPFIGRHPGARHVHDGTGFSGNGMTFGTLAGMMLADAASGVPNPWAGLYDARRIRPLAQARRFVAENADVAARLARDRVRGGEAGDLESIPPGEGRLVREGGKVLAVARREDGSVCVRSAVCPHLGCHVQWNAAEKSWDCPCHGSRYDAEGAVLHGPTTRELAVAEAPTAGEAPSPAAPTARDT